MELRITLYEDWMNQQVSNLFNMEYGTSVEQFSKLITRFYEHPYQINKCVRIVALDGDKVVGFQSFFYWPYYYGGKKVESFQSGNSLVHPDYRGKGLFQKLLNYLEANREQLGIELLVGFPVDASLKSFIKNGWNNIFNLKWCVAPSSYLFSFLGNEHKKLQKHFSTEPVDTGIDSIANLFRVSHARDFTSWRRSYSDHQLYYYTFAEGEKKISFTLKCARRKNIIRELVIGDIDCTHKDPEFMLRGLKALRKAVGKSNAATIISMAFNPFCGYLPTSIIKQAGFKVLEREIYFIVKVLTEFSPAEVPANWIVYRSDIDTW